MDAETFKRTFLPLHAKLYRIAYRIVESQEDAEDILQDTYVKLWEKRSEMPHVLNLESFAVTMLKNACLDFLKKHKIHQVSTDDTDVPAAESFVKQYENREAVELLHLYIERLPQQQKKVFHLHYRDDYSVKEIEQITGLAVSNIKVILSRARNNLKALHLKASIL